MGEAAAEMAHSRGPTSPELAELPGNDDLLSEILLRLPPQPSSLPRASLVCSRWRRLVSDPVFLRRFRARHRFRPPLLGFFREGTVSPTFTPRLAPPDRIPAARFSWRLSGDHVDDYHQLLGCRHGRVLLYNRRRCRLVVWDPVSGDRRALDIPAALDDMGVVVYLGAVRCVHGGERGHSSPFQVAVLGVDEPETRAFVCVYSSDSANWGNVISVALNPGDFTSFSCALVGNFLYWLLGSDEHPILQFDLDKQTAARFETPPEMHPNPYDPFPIAPGEGGGVVILAVSNLSLNLWKSKTNGGGVAGWMLEKTIELDRLFSFGPGLQTRPPVILGFAEEQNLVILGTLIGIFMLNMQSMQLNSFPQTLELGENLPPTMDGDLYYPFTGYYTKELLPQ